MKKIVTKMMSYVLTAIMIVSSISLSPLAMVEAQAAEVRDVNLKVGGSIPGYNGTVESDVLFSITKETDLYYYNQPFGPIDSGNVGKNIWQLTKYPSTQVTFAASRTDNGDLSAGTTVCIHVSDWSWIADNALQAMLVDSSNTVIGYGCIGGYPYVPRDYSFQIPDGMNGGDKLYVFAEAKNYGGSYNYASNMVNVYSNPAPAPTPPENNHDNHDEHNDNQENNNNNNDDQSSNSNKNENTFVNPLSWNYGTNQTDSLCLIEQQGAACKALFKAATPAGYTEAFSFNMLARENGNYEKSYSKKTGKFTLNIPEEYRKSGRSFVLLGMDKNGNVKIFTDEDLSDGSFTTTLDIEGYAFSLIYTDGAAITGTTPGQSGTGSDVYTVQEGDTLSQIAEKLGISRESLIEKNNLANPDKLKIGQKISYSISYHKGFS